MSENQNTEAPKPDPTQTAAPVAPKAHLDPYVLFKQIDALREEGVPEEVIRAAFDEFMQEHSGNFRVPMKRILKTKESLPTMSQVEINAIYEKRFKKPV